MNRNRSLLRRVIGTFIALLAPLAFMPWISAKAQEVPAVSAPLPQAEIAYVLDGDLWLYDTISQSSIQLTQDGDVRWPTWSPDGMTLLYTRAATDDDMQLWAYDMAASNETLIAGSACCGAFAPDGSRFAFIDMTDPTLRARTMDERGYSSTLIDPLEYSRSIWPAGSLLWVITEGSEYLLFPLEIVAGSASEGLQSFGTTLLSEVDSSGAGGELQEMDSGDCTGSVLYSVSALKEPKVIATAATVSANPTSACADEQGPYMRAIYVEYWEGNGGGDFENLGYPSLSPDGAWLTAERYLPAASVDTQELEGIVVVTTVEDVSNTMPTLIIPGGRQPAWRPAAVQPAAVQQARAANERVLTVSPPLMLDGTSYEVHIFTTGDMRQADAHFFKVATPESMQVQGITGFLVTRDGAPVTDADTLRTLYLDYAAADSLYAQPPDTVDLGWQKELGIVLNNPLFMAMQPVEALRSRRDQYADAFRLLLTNAKSDELDALIDKAFEETPATFADALGALTTILDNQRAVSARMGLLSDDLKATFDGFEADISGAENILNVLRFAARLLWIDQLQAERAQWLVTYADSVLDGPGAFDRDQLRALAAVLAEVNDVQQQRVDIAKDIVHELVSTGLVELTGKGATAAATALAQQAAEAAGVRLAGHAVSSALAAVGVGLTVNDILYGVGPLWSGFTLAQRSDELRARFFARREQMEQLAFVSGETWDGDLAGRWRITRLLETIAAAGAQRAYADGVAATFALPNPLELINWLRGEDWQQAVDDLRANADQMEQEQLETYANPAYLPAALALAQERRLLVPSTDITAQDEILIPAGPFQMGCETSDDPDCNAYDTGEMPRHTVTLDAYRIDKYEVTNARYKECVDAGACTPPQSSESATHFIYYGSEEYADYPVVYVDWNQANAFCTWDGGRLPTEAEWEKAARGSDDTRIYPWGSDAPTCDLLNFYDENKGDSCVGDTAAVGSYPAGASPYGVMDMSGNVWEWVNDWYDSAYYSTSPTTNPQGPETGSYRVLRGGSWNGDTGNVRASTRGLNVPGDRYNYNGFRCVRSQ